MNVARELPGIVKLPYGDILIAGGLTGAAAACAATPATPFAFTTNSSAEVYNPTVPSWTLTTGSSSTPGAAGGMNVKRIAAGSLFTTGTDSGLAIFAGGIDAETTNGTSPNFPTCEATTNIHQTTQTATDLYDPSDDRVHGDRRAESVSRRLWLRYPQRGFACGRPGGDRRRMRGRKPGVGGDW